MSSIFGGSKQKASSSNKAYPYIQDTFGSTAGTTGGVSDAISSLLGLGGSRAQSDAFNNYRDSTGYNFQLDQGSKAITGNNAAKGILNSGSTAKALTSYGQNLASQSMNDYLSQLFNLGNLGLGAGSLISGAGNTSTSSGSSKKGIGGFLGNAAGSIAASDRRLKKDIVKIGELNNGLNVYQYNYINDRGPYIGVMVDEVSAIQPEALGPVIDGYGTVDYSKINMGRFA